MLSLRRILLLTCTLSLMLASPTQTHPTGNTALPYNTADSVAPHTLRGRQYQLVKRALPDIFMSPELESTLDDTKAEDSHKTEEPRKTTKPPSKEGPQKYNPETSNTETTETMPPKNETTTSTTPSSNVAPRRLVPYSEDLVERAFVRTLEERRLNHLSRASPETTSPPAVGNTFMADRTSDTSDAQAGDHSSSGKKGRESVRKSSKVSAENHKSG